MTAQEQTRPQGRTLWLLYLVYFVGWIVACGLALWIILQLRVNLLDIFVALRLDPWAMGAVDKFGIVLFGLGWLVVTLVTEVWLRQAVTANKLWARLARLFGLEALLLAISYGLQFMMTW